MIRIGSGLVEMATSWTTLKAIASSKSLSLQYEDDTLNNLYFIFAIDSPVIYTTVIFKGTVPVVSDTTQIQNDADKTDFTTSYQAFANYPVTPGRFDDPRLSRRFGNLTATATTEVLVSARAYNEQSAQAQRSVKSSSAQDASAGTGAKAVRITYLASNYVLKTEDVALNGTTAVATVATDIRFVESFKVIQGSAAAGAIELWTATNGTGTAICGIGAGTEDAFLCHHYVPAGMKAIVRKWGATVSDDANMKLKGQVLYGVNRVDVNLDLDGLTGIAAGTRLSFDRPLEGVVLGEKTYLRVTTAPVQATSTIVRSFIEFWEGKA